MADTLPPPDAPRKKARRGFAAMPADTQRAIASLGGKAAHARGTAHEFTAEEARAAGRKGGQALRTNRAREMGRTPLVDDPLPDTVEPCSAESDL